MATKPPAVWALIFETFRPPLVVVMWKKCMMRVQ